MAEQTQENLLKARKILQDVLWAFGLRFDTKEDFSRAVKQYQIDITGKDSWQPAEIVAEQSEIKVLLERDWEMSPDDLLEFVLKSENSKNFTALDLMFQLNNSVSEHDLGDYVFFEGLSYSAENGAYSLILGS